MKASRDAIDRFLAGKKIAIAGVSRDPKKFGHIVFRTLREKGYEVFPVNPSVDSIDGIPCFRSVATLPLSVHNLLVLTPKQMTRDVVAEALAKGIDSIWIQQMSDTPEAIALTRSKNINLITGACILMHADPVKGIHKFHRNILKLFGMYPR
jgi:predicted CoA-binding protein